MNRRQFITSSTAAVVAGNLPAAASVAPTRSQIPLIVSTWPSGKPANDRAIRVFAEGGSPLDAVEQGIHVSEADPGRTSVGYGGTPNAAGVVQLDACIMDGPEHRAGSVAACERILHPISVARKVMEETPHVMIAGDGARTFALEHGFEEIELLTEERRQAWVEWRRQQGTLMEMGPDHHDTIALLVLGSADHIAGGCSTSGWGYKPPGRVGDSPIIGSGLYVDNKVGAAGATGTGENVMRYCGSFMVVELMRQGLHPAEACAQATRRIAEQDPRGFDLDIHFVALDRHGRHGAAGTSEHFAYSVTTNDTSEVVQGLGRAEL
ncbi:MAG: N(4)-(beta-N-acetylglucosaminyl)-L-asparaginase [Gemmatimonadetes bacterium]|jgi:N4-(beta-N-acetylglucosaminyl)-L-asparaginase|nr:N(4)-(beta-N-acetylglucosaminyl)-L-asparaginase [Gemmatimonadota bacterium]MBT6145265.1 N(4)-(beta-N-acetylglucosaminyl)-L-asparaginase [Gemmatimonadota bacterium]